MVIDEASQAIEAVTYVPLSLCRPIHGVMVLTGDPKQLGASALSPFYHLDNAAESLLDRVSPPHEQSLDFYFFLPQLGAFYRDSLVIHM